MRGEIRRNGKNEDKGRGSMKQGRRDVRKGRDGDGKEWKGIKGWTGSERKMGWNGNERNIEKGKSSLEKGN